ncbi:SOS response-associated peptidase [Chitinophaga sedimenti]|uniref:SOS response-associated peptidase n=1 Tax=Chitinophaga sedimenti TaxID=2033606 RepID=UPI0020049F0D|nr:SOS response-associated peptidase family protein [Chitinophaga sedimenti]MCK7559366.1 SOS response-associated peptidase [Chitinophaga sedimenti]
MCRDISFHSEIEEVQKVYPGLKDIRTRQLDTQSLIHRQAEVFASYPIIATDEGQQVLADMEWGIKPLHIQDKAEATERRRSMVNAKADRILGDTSSYWHRLSQNRCLIPLTNIFEHRKIMTWTKKVPYAIRTTFHSEGLPYYVPGLYQWHYEPDENGQAVRKGTFTLVTTEANNVMRCIHNDGANKHRMPLFLTKEMENAWLNHTLTKADMTEILQYIIPDQHLNYHTVHSLRTEGDRPDHKPKDALWIWENLPPLGNDYPRGVGEQSSLF